MDIGFWSDSPGRRYYRDIRAQGRQAEPPLCTSRQWSKATGVALVAVVGLAVLGFVQTATADPATEPQAPAIESAEASSEYSGQETIEAEIDPQSYETRWTISLECTPKPRCQSAEGRLPSDDQHHLIKAIVTGLEPDTSYRYTIEASSSAGVTSIAGEFESIPAGACPDGCGTAELYRPPEPPWADQSGKEAAERTVNEQREKEQKEREAAARYLSERQTHPTVGHPQARTLCIVPALKGDTLAVAQRKLAEGHCRLGRVHRRPGQLGTLHVSRQGTPAGKRLNGGARVALWMRASPRRS